MMDQDDYSDIPPLQRTWNTNRDRLIQESAMLSRELVDSIGDLSKIQNDYSAPQKHRDRISSGGSSPLHPHSFSIDDPSTYVNDVKAALSEDRGLNPRNRDYIIEVLERLAERVTSAEISRNVVVGELVTMRERFQVRILNICMWILYLFNFTICRPKFINGAQIVHQSYYRY